MLSYSLVFIKRQIYYSEFFEIVKQCPWAATSILTPLLSSDNLLTGHEKSSLQQFKRNLSTCVLLAKDWLMLHEKFNHNLSTCFL